ncbi:MAG: ankyrin repeat domain-containing protein [Candidatus Sulfotelmatobacter sp.]
MRILIAVVLAGLLAASAYAQTTDFFELVKSGTPQDVQAAIDQGADVIAQGKYGYTPLMLAANNNPNSEVITILLKAGAEINAQDIDGNTALMGAAGNNNPAVITTLLNVGADINVSNKMGMTALMAAAWYNQNPEVIAILLKAGADVNAEDDKGMTALIYATSVNQNPKPEMITTLLKAGANVNARDEYGTTPLMYAASRSSNPEVITTLMQAGADVKAKGSDGKTAFDFAQNNENLRGTDALRKLQEASKKEAPKLAPSMPAQTVVPLQKLVTFPAKYVNKSIKLEPCRMDANGIKAVDKKTFFTVFFADMGLHVPVKEWYGWESPCALVDAETAEKLVDYIQANPPSVDTDYPVNIYGTVRRDKDPFGSGDIYNLFIDKIEILSWDDLTTVVETFNCTWK